MVYSPKRGNRNAFWASLILFIIAAGSFLGSAVLPYKAVLQVIAIICVTLGIQITQKYILTDYEYSFSQSTDDYGTTALTLTVVKIQGRRSTVMCNLNVNSRCSIVEAKPVKELEATYGKINFRYDFCVDMRPKTAYTVILDFRGDKAALKLQCDDDFAKAFSEAIPNEDDEF